MGLLKQLTIFGKSGLQGLPTRVTLPLRDIRPQCGCPKGLLGSPYSQHGTLWQARGGPQYLETFRACPIRAIVPQHRPPGQRWILGGGLRVGGPGRPFWRTPAVTLKINTGTLNTVTHRESATNSGLNLAHTRGPAELSEGPGVCHVKYEGARLGDLKNKP